MRALIGCEGVSHQDDMIDVSYHSVSFVLYIKFK